eukprot:9885227-Lingulodinium_polyedra.AAC.1
MARRGHLRARAPAAAAPGGPRPPHGRAQGGASRARFRWLGARGWHRHARPGGHPGGEPPPCVGCSPRSGRGPRQPR